MLLHFSGAIHFHILEYRPKYDFGFVAVHVSLVVGYYEVCLLPFVGYNARVMVGRDL